VNENERFSCSISRNKNRWYFCAVSDKIRGKDEVFIVAWWFPHQSVVNPNNPALTYDRLTLVQQNYIRAVTLSCA